MDNSAEIETINAEIAAMERRLDYLRGRRHILDTEQKLKAKKAAMRDAVAKQQERDKARAARLETALRLHGEGKTYKQIGEAIGVSGARAKSIVMHAEYMARYMAASRPAKQRTIEHHPARIEQGDVSTRLYKRLSNEGLLSYDDLLRRPRRALFDIPQFGQICMVELEEFLGKRGLHLRDDAAFVEAYERDKAEAERAAAEQERAERERAIEARRALLTAYYDNSPPPYVARLSADKDENWTDAILGR